MTVEVTTADEQWNGYVGQSPQATSLHREEALTVMADHTDATLHRLVGYKGQEPVGIFPIFELSKGPLQGAFSPPPRLSVPYLGPALLNLDKLKQRKAERRAKRFVESSLDWLDESLSPHYSQFVTGCGFHDARPFRWRGCELSPGYTYTVDLTGSLDDLKRSFSSDARNNIDESASGSVEEGTATDARRIIEQVRDRYDGQDRPYSVPAGFAADLYRRLPDGRIRPFVYRVDGQPVGGLLTFEDDTTIYRWQGGVKPDFGVSPAVNDHLDWEVIRSASERGLETYDLVGAGVPRINEYKAKFNPELRTFYRVVHGTWPTTTLVDIYRKLA